MSTSNENHLRIATALAGLTGLIITLSAAGCASNGNSQTHTGQNRADGAAIGSSAGSEIGSHVAGRNAWLGSEVGSILGRRSGESVGDQIDAKN